MTFDIQSITPELKSNCSCKRRRKRNPSKYETSYPVFVVGLGPDLQSGRGIRSGGVRPVGAVDVVQHVDQSAAGVRHSADPLRHAVVREHHQVHVGRLAQRVQQSNQLAVDLFHRFFDFVGF